MRPALACAVLLAAAGCATQPCDPHADRNIFQVGGCIMGGGYQQRQDALQGRLDQANLARGAAQADLADAMAQRDATAARRAELEATLAGQRVRSQQMQWDLAAVQGRTAQDQQRLQQIQAQLTEVNGELERLRANAPSEELRQRLAAAHSRQDELNRLIRLEAERSLAAVPRD